MKSTVVPLLAAAVVAASASAEENAQDQGVILEEIIVTAHPLSGEGLSQSSKVLQGVELDRKRATNIGETLAREPGIHSAQFGNAVGRPVIHGLGGPRVRVMEDRIDTLDVSVTSADHAVSVEPFIADRVEVLKGPSTLLYGSGAIGGVVDVHTGRIPHARAETISGAVETRYNDNTEGNSTAAELNGGVGGFAWHLDYTRKDGNDYEIPGFAESSRLRALEAAEEEEHEDEDHDEEEHDEDHEHEEEVRDVLPGSEFESESFAIGGSFVGDWGFVGLSVSQFEADYGLPGGHSHGHEEGHDEEHEGEEDHEDEEEHDHEEEVEGNPLLELEQTRVDFELGVENPFANFTSLNVRLGYNDYEHQEIEPNGEVATRFENEAWELRAELVYEQADWTGAFGFQHLDREFSAVGEEAFVPPVDTQQTGVFWVGEKDFGNFSLETGARLGRVEHDPQAGGSEDFNTYALSVGFVIPWSDALSLGVVADYSSRAPVGEELFSNGAHLATNAFEIGDRSLDNERAMNLAATLRFDSDRWDGAVTAYYTRFADFIYEQATGEEEDELPVFQFRQDDATFFGVDAELDVELVAWQGGSLGASVMFDFVDADVDARGQEYLPRISPLRYGAGLHARFGILDVGVEYLRVTEQDDVSPNELKTDAYDDLRVYADAAFQFDNATLTVFVNGTNLTDDEQRKHTSFIKDFAPAPGRAVEAGLRLRF